MHSTSIPYGRLLRRYRAKTFVRNKVKLQSDPVGPRVTPELLREAGARMLDINAGLGHTAEPMLGLDDKRRIAILEREVRMLRQDIVQLRMRK